MFDAALRRTIAPTVDGCARALVRLGVRPPTLTVAGFVAGVGACWAAATGQWLTALVLWLVNRALDGLDGPVARAGNGATPLGGFLDVVADFTVYAGFVVGVAVAVPDARLACVALIAAYYVSGAAFLTLSSLIERYRSTAQRGNTFADERSLRFVGGLAEGAETIVAYVLFCLFPGAATVIAWLFTGAVGVTAVQRVVIGVRLLRGLPASD